MTHPVEMCRFHYRKRLFQPGFVAEFEVAEAAGRPRWCFRTARNWSAGALRYAKSEAADDL